MFPLVNNVFIESVKPWMKNVVYYTVNIRNIQIGCWKIAPLLRPMFFPSVLMQINGSVIRGLVGDQMCCRENKLGDDGVSEKLAWRP